MSRSQWVVSKKIRTRHEGNLTPTYSRESCIYLSRELNQHLDPAQAEGPEGNLARLISIQIKDSL